MPDGQKFGFDTLQIHAGARPDPATGARQVPIYQTTAYVFRDADHAAALFNLQEVGYIYSRLTNPTIAALQERVATLEGGVGAVCCSSGHAAQIMALFPLMGPGLNLVASTRLYGGSITQLSQTIRRFGWTAKFVDFDDLDAVRAACDENTRAIFCESIANPGGYVTDLDAIAKIADDEGVPLIVDNTVATPALIRPIDYGADIVVYSLTKYLGGHGTSLGGMIVDSGRFPWAEHAERFPMLNEPEPSYHGVVYTEALGPAAYIGRARTVPLRNTGSCISPFNAFLILQGIETLTLRMERHCANARAVADYLVKHPKVAWVKYAGLPDSPYYQLAQKYSNGAPSGLLSFGIKGGFEAGVKFYDALKIFKRLVNIGDAKSLAAHPASTTHRQLSDEELVSAGVTPDMIRLCVGIEHIDDILADLGQALG
ncbi:MAG: O-acetylhomoserine aminocarboxypropyltransferase/cysteine synthase [Planctomycetales bacterium]|nr:O-acetylhomoserine aminocarboxypropyltransferase/cysteine synthase [Planctomycetales bacterium]